MENNAALIKDGIRSSELMLADEEDINKASRALKAMAHPLRLKILCILGSATEFSVQDLVEMVGTSQSNIDRKSVV